MRYKRLTGYSVEVHEILVVADLSVNPSCCHGALTKQLLGGGQ